MIAAPVPRVPLSLHPWLASAGLSGLCHPIPSSPLHPIPPSPRHAPREIWYHTRVDLIVSHTNADFDALASMVAASLLYPGALMSLPAGADRNVREFLALHGDLITLVPPQDVPLDRVARLIVVETQHEIGRAHV